MNKGNYITMSLPLIEVVDKPAYIAYSPNIGNPALLDSWNCKIEILKLDYARFDFCSRPDDFEFILDGVTASITHDPLPDPINVRAQAFSGNRVLQVLVKYPSPVTDIDRPYLQIVAATAPLYAGDPMDSTDISVVINDTIAGGLEWFNFSCDINATFDVVTITNNNPKLLMPSILDGGSFQVTV
jgi:hypothetical protein